MWHLKTATVPVKMRVLGMIKKKRQINTLTKYLGIQAYRKFKKLHFIERLISLGEDYHCY